MEFSRSFRHDGSGAESVDGDAGAYVLDPSHYGVRTQGDTPEGFVVCARGPVRDGTI